LEKALNIKCVAETQEKKYAQKIYALKMRRNAPTEQKSAKKIVVFFYS